MERIVEKPYDVIKENIITEEWILDIRESQVEKYKNEYKYENVHDDIEVLPTQINYEYVDKIVNVPRYVDNIIEKEVKVEKQKVIEIAKEKVIHKKVPHYIERKV